MPRLRASSGDLPRQRRHILMYDEDWEFLVENYGPFSDSKKGAGWAAATLIHVGVKQLRGEIQKAQDKREQPSAALPLPSTEVSAS